jgi:hypothetical protein
MGRPVEAAMVSKCRTEAFLRRPHIGRRRHQIACQVHVVELQHAAGGGVGVAAAYAHQHRAALVRHFQHGGQRRALFGQVQLRRLAGGAAHHQAVHALGDQAGGQVL